MNFLFGLGLEELPARSIKRLEEALKEKFHNVLQSENLIQSSIQSCSTPRRLAVLIENLPPKTPSREETISGPSPNAPSQAIEGFAKKQGVTTSDLFEQNGRLCAKKVLPSKPIDEVLKLTIDGLSEIAKNEKLMQWANCEHTFIRPVKWVLAILDSKVLEVEVLGVKSSNFTRPNRLLEAGTIKLLEIKSVESYFNVLRENLVEPSREKRKEKIETEIKALESREKISANKQDDLLDEVVDILEWPTILMGEFEEEYLNLPPFLVETVLIHHQRYFPCYDSLDKLSKKFLFAANCLPKAQKTVIEGNQRVLRARLNDAKFFVNEDKKSPLIDNLSKLKAMTFQKELEGVDDSSMFGKVQRMKKLAEELNDNFKKVSLDRLLEAVELCKCDLVSQTVFEFPELQGKMGGYLINNIQTSINVGEMVSNHYEVLHLSSPEQAALSIIDKIDNLQCLFYLGKKPTGSADPFALRRQAQSVVNDVIDNFPKLRVGDLISKDFGFAGKVDEKRIKSAKEDLKKFFSARLEFTFSSSPKLSEVLEIIKPEIEALNKPFESIQQLGFSLSEFIQIADQESLRALQNLRRIFRILKDFDSPDESLLKEIEQPNEEQELLIFVQNSFNLKEILPPFDNLSEVVKDSLDKPLKDLTPKVEAFFDTVMVEDPDLKVAKRRKTLLNKIKEKFLKAYGLLDLDALINAVEAKLTT
jgi:glycyl-tRNA synthetase beta chain